MATASCENVFVNLSYFEFFALQGYISKFPSKLTTLNAPFTEKTPINLFESTVSKVSDKVWNSQFDRYFKTLNDRNFGISDVFWWLPAKFPMSPTELRKYIANATMEPGVEAGDVTPTHQCLVIKNNLDPTFSTTAFYKDVYPLAGEAIDVIPLFVFNGQPTIYTALGFKRESPRVPITLSTGDVIHVLTVGIYGNVIFGEHLNPEEKACMNENSEKFLATRQRVLLGKHETSAVMRTLAEEAGITNMNCREAFYVDFSRTCRHQKCRDSRYGLVFGKYNQLEYGYPRESIAHTVCCVFDCSPPENPIPADQDECSKPTVLPLETAIKHFKVGGKYNPAFPAHVTQLENCMHMMKTYKFS